MSLPLVFALVIGSVTPWVLAYRVMRGEARHWQSQSEEWEARHRPIVPMPSSYCRGCGRLVGIHRTAVDRRECEAHPPPWAAGLSADRIAHYRRMSDLLGWDFYSEGGEFDG